MGAVGKEDRRVGVTQNLLVNGSGVAVHSITVVLPAHLHILVALFLESKEDEADYQPGPYFLSRCPSVWTRRKNRAGIIQGDILSLP